MAEAIKIAITFILANYPLTFLVLGLVFAGFAIGPRTKTSGRI